ncbi:helix-hairpin-helix domain-containing protein [Nocardiopsis sp. EMB25]|uniref:helix-hairpin-helix domain-containing protein n=1 Tax=Nocardiopsis sp. EMB25 TaxID=2835867 RepID=UPI002283C3B1|nr:helix-hairpin-helix domain-containing protein [Nocardiopsis sp. EMB25]MCY9787241.1 helix-hairpin-helix domain-containing protein [Nocardiopsis sp. EMB25]
MTTLTQLRKAALALPEVEEGTRSGMVVFSVRGAGFVSVAEDGRVRLRLPVAEVEAAEAAHPGGDRIVREEEVIGFGLPLADVDGQKLNALVRAAWYHRAPERLAKELAAADAGTGPADGDLPAGIGKPATRALLGAGLGTLAEVATRSEKELLALHGVGPKAVRILRETLAEKGMSLR